MRKNIFIFLGLLWPLFFYGQSFNLTQVDSLFSNVELENKAMGTVSIFQEGAEVYQRSIGYRNLKSKQKANRNTKYRIGSISKTFTATIIMQLVDEGKLKLDSKLSDFFPEVVNADIISIELLLLHRSGLFNITDSKNFRAWAIEKHDRKEILAKVNENEPIFSPNERTKYSNTNYILLSMIAEDIEKRSFSEIVNSRIVKPLKLKQTQYGGLIKPYKNDAIPYYFDAPKWNKMEHLTDMSNPMGAGSIVSTPLEVNIFYQNLFNRNFISKASLEKMKKSIQGMGMGMFTLKFYGLEMFGHDGGIDGFTSLAIAIPERKITAVITLNGSTIPVQPLMLSMLELFFKNDTIFRKNIKVSYRPEDLDKYIGVYSSETFPAKVTFTKKNAILFAQATGQPIFELSAIAKNVFKYNAMGIIFSFNPPKEELFVDFEGKKHKFIKE